MKTKIYGLLAGIIALASLTGCGTDPQLTQFKKDMDNFCIAISELDTSINHINAEDENAPQTVLKYLDQLDAEFQKLADMDFPEEFDYLEALADEAGEYMSTAVSSYHDIYEKDNYSAETADYARENSARAFKRVRVIITCLHGEDPSSAAAEQP